MDRTTYTERLMLIINRISILLSSGFGVGYSPYAPGTCGSILGLLIFLCLNMTRYHSLTFQVMCAILLSIIGIMTAGMTSRILGVKDPSLVVIDEITGMFISLIGHFPTVLNLLIGFFLFRLLDIYKPFPIRDMERLKGGLGIMADDILAGVITNICLCIIP